MLLTLLFWLGVALAPLAALLLLLVRGESGLRIAAVLAVLAVVLIGLSITLRRDIETVRLELEETLLDEVDLLREDVRQDIATAARATHRQFSEKLQALYESVEALRGQISAARYEPAAAPQQGYAGQAQQGYAGQAQQGYAGQAQQGYAGQAHDGPAPHVGAGSHVAPGRAGVHPGPNAHTGHARAAAPAPAPGPVVGGGVVRHTETVQVTTRQTIVDPHESSRGTVYGGGGNGYDSGEFGRSDSGPAQRAARWGEPVEESWTEQRLRERLGQRVGETRSEQRSANGDGRRSRAYEPDDEDSGGDSWSGGSSWSARRTGPGSVEDRWASVRSDDRGRELRMGERRAAMHADDSGTELRIEDRWASVLREESLGRRSAEGRRRAEDRRGTEDRPGTEDRWGGGDDRWSDDRWGPGVEDTGRWGDRRALPASSSEPTWSDSRGEGRRRRYRDDDDEPYSWEAELQDPPRRARERERWGG